MVVLAKTIKFYDETEQHNLERVQNIYEAQTNMCHADQNYLKIELNFISPIPCE